MMVAKDLKFITENDFRKIFDQTEKTALILNGLIRSTEKLSKS